jgi:type I restriction enzyme S subunit
VSTFDVERWPSKPLGSLATFTNGRSFRPDEWSDSGLPIIRIQNLTDPDNDVHFFSGDVDPKHRIADGDLLVSWSASLDAYWWDRGPAALNQHIFKVKECADRVDRRFLYYALRAVMESIRGQIHGSTMQHITKPKFESVEVRVPSGRDVQEAVSEMLCAKLAEADKIRGRLRLQLDAARALLGATIDATVARYANSLETLGDVWVSPPKSGWSPVCDDDPRGTPVLTLTSVTGFFFRADAVKFTSEPVSRDANYWAADGDLFITRSNTPELVGHAAIAAGITRPTVFPDLLLRLEVDRGRVMPEFAHLWLMSGTARRYIRFEAVGSSGTMKKVNRKILERLPFPTNVALKEQEEVVAQLSRHMDAVRKISVAVDSATVAADALPAAILRETFDPNLEEVTD